AVPERSGNRFSLCPGAHTTSPRPGAERNGQRSDFRTRTRSRSGRGLCSHGQQREHAFTLFASEEDRFTDGSRPARSCLRQGGPDLRCAERNDNPEDRVPDPLYCPLVGGSPLYCHRRQGRSFFVASKKLSDRSKHMLYLKKEPLLDPLRSD